MGATNHTPNINLSQFVDTDKPTWRGDYNGDMQKIDTNYKSLSDSVAALTTQINNEEGAPVHYIPPSVPDLGIAINQAVAAGHKIIELASGGEWYQLHTPACFMNTDFITIKGDGGGNWNSSTAHISCFLTTYTTTLSSNLSTSAPITAIPCSAFPGTLVKGEAVTIRSGSNWQKFHASADVPNGATSIPVLSQTPNFAYTAGSVVDNADHAAITVYGTEIVSGATSLRGMDIMGNDSHAHGVYIQSSYNVLMFDVGIESWNGAGLWLDVVGDSWFRISIQNCGRTNEVGWPTNTAHSTLSAGFTPTGTTTAIPIAALTGNIVNGQTVIVGPDTNGMALAFVASAAVESGATSIPVVALSPAPGTGGRPVAPTFASGVTVHTPTSIYPNWPDPGDPVWLGTNSNTQFSALHVQATRSDDNSNMIRFEGNVEQNKTSPFITFLGDNRSLGIWFKNIHSEARQPADQGYRDWANFGQSGDYQVSDSNVAATFRYGVIFGYGGLHLNGGAVAPIKNGVGNAVTDLLVSNVNLGGIDINGAGGRHLYSNCIIGNVHIQYGPNSYFSNCFIGDVTINHTGAETNTETNFDQCNLQSLFTTDTEQGAIRNSKVIGTITAPGGLYGIFDCDAGGYSPNPPIGPWRMKETGRQTLNGTSGGTATYVMKWSNSGVKVVVYFTNYLNTTDSAQKIMFPFWLSAGTFTHNDMGGGGLANDGLVLPWSMSTAINGWAVIEGYSA